MPDPNTLVPLLFLAAILGGPIVLVVLFVAWRAKRRRARLRGPWTALAEKLGGQFHEGAGLGGSSLHAQRPTHTVGVRMTLVSAMQAQFSPFYPDGGTYTEVTASLLPQAPASFVAGTKVLTFRDPARVPALSQVGSNASVYLEPKTARIVFPGVVEDFGLLDAAVQSLEDITRIVLLQGPLQPAAAA